MKLNVHNEKSTGRSPICENSKFIRIRCGRWKLKWSSVNGHTTGPTNRIIIIVQSFHTKYDFPNEFYKYCSPSIRAIYCFEMLFSGRQAIMPCHAISISIPWHTALTARSPFWFIQSGADPCGFLSRNNFIYKILVVLIFIERHRIQQIQKWFFFWPRRRLMPDTMPRSDCIHKKKPSLAMSVSFDLCSKHLMTINIWRLRWRCTRWCMHTSPMPHAEKIALPHSKQ